MLICQFLVAIIGVTVGFNKTHDVNGTSMANNIPAVNAQIAFIAIYIFFFASTWGPGAWVVIGESCPPCFPFAHSRFLPYCVLIGSVAHVSFTHAGEIFPLPIRSRGVGLSTASNWLWNTIIAVITPYMVNPGSGNLRSSVFFVWVGLLHPRCHFCRPLHDYLMGAHLHCHCTGLPLHMRLCLRLLPHPRDKGSHTRTNRSDARGDDTAHIGRLGTKVVVLGGLC